MVLRIKTLHDNPQSNFMDLVIERLRLKNDAALSRALNVQSPVVSKMRANTLGIGPTHIIRFHELTDMPIREIKERLGQKSLTSERQVAK